MVKRQSDDKQHNRPTKNTVSCFIFKLFTFGPRRFAPFWNYIQTHAELLMTH